MPRFLATTSPGLAEVLESEIQDLGLKVLGKNQVGVRFESNWQGCYLANLKLRTAIRVLMPVLDFSAYQNDDLYFNVKKHDFTKYISAHQTIAVDATVSDSPKFKDQRFVALKVKDAIVDQFREKFDKRPNVDSKDPHLKVHVRIKKNDVSVSVDTTGEPLFKRGYRRATVQAPVKEHMAAGLLMMSGWKPGVPLVDPMCGSGTFLFEAALMAMNKAPGLLREDYSFMYWKNFQDEAWEKVYEEVKAEEIPLPDDQILVGYDNFYKAIDASMKNAEVLGLQNKILFKKQELEELRAPAESGIVVVNPPYGVRLGEVERLEEDYARLSKALKENFQGWEFWILSGQKELTPVLRMKSKQRYPVQNGPIECRFLGYVVR